MKEKDQGGIKSALELAMEKMNREGGKKHPLTDAQKRGLQEIERELTAKIAEIDILARQGIEEARAVGDQERLQALEDQKTRETARLRREAERRKEKIRKGAGR